MVVEISSKGKVQTGLSVWDLNLQTLTCLGNRSSLEMTLFFKGVFENAATSEMKVKFLMNQINDIRFPLYLHRFYLLLSLKSFSPLSQDLEEGIDRAWLKTPIWICYCWGGGGGSCWGLGPMIAWTRMDPAKTPKTIPMTWPTLYDFFDIIL